MRQVNRSDPAHNSYQNQTQGNEISQAVHSKWRFCSACWSQGLGSSHTCGCDFSSIKLLELFSPVRSLQFGRQPALGLIHSEADQTEMVWIPLPKLLQVSCMNLVLIYNKFSSDLLCPTSAKHLDRCVPQYVFKLRLKLNILLSHDPRLCHWILHLGNEDTASFLTPFGRLDTLFGQLYRNNGRIFYNNGFKWHKILK